MPLQETSGAASYDAFGGGVAAVPNYIEDVFSTWLYTGTSANQTITNGIDLSGKGGLTWIKNRTNAGYPHMLYDTIRGATKSLSTNDTVAQLTYADSLTAFNSNGFSLGADTVSGNVNNTGENYVSWTFEKQPKFFDVVTYTGNGVDGRAISHNLGAIPRFIIVKRTNASAEWRVYAYTPTGPQSFYLALNTTGADGQVTGGYVENPTLTQFQTYEWSGDISTVNADGGTYVAYLFASNAGGFGLSGTDNVISCGTYTGNGSTNSITVGFEPQWLMIKRTNNTGSWHMMDIMRGMPLDGNSIGFTANTSTAEGGAYRINPTATGFQIRSETAAEINSNTSTYIYIAIRRPMKVPTTGTSVYATDTFGGSSGGTAVPAYRAPFPVDFAFEKRTNASDNWIVNDRLRGVNSLNFNLEAAEALYDAEYKMDFMNGWINYTGSNSQYRSWMMRRAPGFMDICCYTGNGTIGRTINHNLGAVPEMMIIKRRNGADKTWVIYTAALGATKNLVLDDRAVESDGSAYWNTTTPTSTVFSVADASAVNNSGDTYVAYLFSTCPGVSKLGSYTGNGSSQTINCGFTGGARFVMIKRTDSIGDWYVWDTARGIDSGNDPYLRLNSTVAEVTSNDTIDTDSTGFVVNQVSANNVNVSSATYIFLAIA